MKQIHEGYLQKKYRQIQNLGHLHMGFGSLIQKPIYNILFMVLIGVFGVAWAYRKKWLITGLFSQGSLQIGAEALLLLSYIVILLVVVLGIGTLRARKVEAQLVKAFKPQDLRYGAPVLKGKRKEGVNATVYEFYTVGIPLSVWQERKGEIEHVLDIHFITPYIEYGGRNHSSSKTVLLYTARGQLRNRSEPLYYE